MKNNIRLMLVALFVSFMLAGCPRFPTASENYTQKARQFSPSPGRAAIYVMRPGQFVAAGSYIGVFIDHKKFGRLPPPSFIYAEILPREHILELAEVSGTKNTSLRFKAEEGKCYFFFAEVKLSGNLSLEALSEEKGKELVNKYEQSIYNEYDYGDKSPTKPQ